MSNAKGGLMNVIDDTYITVFGQVAAEPLSNQDSLAGELWYRIVVPAWSLELLNPLYIRALSEKSLSGIELGKYKVESHLSSHYVIKITSYMYQPSPFPSTFPKGGFNIEGIFGLSGING